MDIIAARAEKACRVVGLMELAGWDFNEERAENEEKRTALDVELVLIREFVTDPPSKGTHR